jgi:hypothetical protein
MNKLLVWSILVGVCAFVGGIPMAFASNGTPYLMFAGLAMVVVPLAIFGEPT